MNVIDLFSGGGGLTEGFTRQNYKIIAHVEKDQWACETLKTRIIYYYLKQRNDLDLYEDYITNANNYRKINENREKIFCKYPELRKKLEYEVLNYTFGNPQEDNNCTSIDEIIRKIKKSMNYNKIRKVGLIIGGPPCQAYSLVGRGVMKDRAEADKRNYLFRYYKQIVQEFSPNMFVFENVPGIITAKKGNILKAINDEFDEIGYKLLSGINENPKENIVECVRLGIPQNRKRVILFGFKKELKLKYPNIEKYRLNFNNITTRDAIGDLPKRQSNEGYLGEILSYPILNKLSEYQEFMRADSKYITLHQTRFHNPLDKKIYSQAIKKASNGEKFIYTDIPKNHRTHKNIDAFIDRYKVHWWDNTPHTILAHLAKDGHYNIHPDIDQCRSLSVREAARIQTFPDNYFFEGPRTAQFTQIGNAVPPLLAEMIAKALKTNK